MGGLLRNYGIKRISDAFKRECLNVRSYAVLCREAKGLDQFLARPGRRTQQPTTPQSSVERDQFLWSRDLPTTNDGAIRKADAD